MFVQAVEGGVGWLAVQFTRLAGTAGSAEKHEANL